jgi:hypothetical protein
VLTLTAFDPAGPVLAEYKRERVPAEWIPGLVAVVCSHGPVRRSPERSTAADFGFAPRPFTDRGGNVRAAEALGMPALRFTDAAALRAALVERGVLRLDQPIKDLLPEFDKPEVFVGGTAEAPQTVSFASMAERQRTLARVAGAIVIHQRKFLDEGPEAIVPLKMQQIADEVGVHVTTISRAVDDKWIQTPRGIFPLRRFFVFGTQTADGEDVAYETIRLKLQEIIDKEDKTRPYSDDELMEELQKHGLGVARRTITKYRKKMGIPSSRQRRDWTK